MNLGKMELKLNRIKLKDYIFKFDFENKKERFFMKKVMILVASLVVSVSSFSGYTSDMIKRMEIKEKSVEESFAFGGSNVEMKEAAVVIFKSWDNELNKVYKLLMSKLSKKEQVKLRNEEKAWIKRKERAAEEAADRFCETVNGNKLCGTGYGLEYTGSLINSTRDRAIELSKRYEKLK